MPALITGYYVEKDYLKKLDNFDEEVSKKNNNAFKWYHLDISDQNTKEWLENKLSYQKL